MKNIHPGFILFVLLLASLAASGWLYGLHWKQVALGEKFSPVEKQLILLQNQVEALTAENDRLAKMINLPESSGESRE